MKSWLNKFRISNALDDGRYFSPSLKRTLDQSDELRRFVDNSKAVEQTLKQPLWRQEDSPQLHESIMRAVRNSQRTPDPAAQPLWPRWIPAASAGLLVLLGIMVASQHSLNSNRKTQPAELPALAVASSAIDLGGSLVRQAPDFAMSPLSDEMQKLDRNLVDAKSFLLASLP